MMTFVVDGHIRAISVELVGRLGGDFRSCLPRSCAMLVNAVPETYVNALCILSPYRRGTPGTRINIIKQGLARIERDLSPHQGHSPWLLAFAPPGIKRGCLSMFKFEGLRHVASLPSHG
jgi:hypothetical protein